MRLDPRVVGLVLTGSRAHVGTATERSDYDVLIVGVDEEDLDLIVESWHDAHFDVTVLPLADFRIHALPGSGTEWNRYAFSRCRVLKDTEEGLITSLAAAKGMLSEAEAAELGPQVLDGFLNFVYRCVKSDRDGDLLSARLDAAQALPGFLTYIFALHHRIRPYNKYLAWELTHYPLSESVWAANHVLPLLTQALSPEPVAALRQLMTELEPLARSAGHGPVLDGWGEDLDLMRDPQGVRSD
jgi:predicted nucleotidyltransferase